jgi:hypothetical protein
MGFRTGLCAGFALFILICVAAEGSGRIIIQDTFAHEASSSSFILQGGGLDSMAGVGSSSTFFDMSAGGQAISGVASSSSFIACAGILCDQEGDDNAALTFTIDAGETVSFGTLGFQSRITRTTRLKVDTSNSGGYQLTAGRQRAMANVTLASSANPASANINDAAGGIDVFGGLGGSCGAEAWPSTAGVSTGLGYTLWAASMNKDTSCWGVGNSESASTNRYAALQASNAASSFLNATSNNTNPSFASVGYSLEILQLQQMTNYSGQIVFSATANP